MSAPARRDPLEVAAELHRTGQARVYDLERHRELVVSTPARLLQSKVVWVATGSATAWFGTAGVLVATELAVAAGWTMLAVPVVVVLALLGWWGRLVAVEFAARDTMRRRDRRAYRADDGHRTEPLADPISDEPAGAEWGSMTRRQAALPQRDRSLPASTHRELS